MNINNIHRSAVSLCVILLLAGCAVSKKEVAIQQITPKTTFCELKKISATYNSGKVYLNWLVNTNISNYYFVLEKSIDGGNTFNTIQVQKGFPCPIAIKEGLLYSYIDEKLTVTSRIYRLKAVQPIKNGQKLLLYTASKNILKDNEKALLTVKNDNRTTSK